MIEAEERTVLGSPVDVVTYSGSATLDRPVTNVRFVVASVERGDDGVTVAGIHAVEFDETDNLRALMERVEREHDAPESA